MKLTTAAAYAAFLVSAGLSSAQISGGTAVFVKSDSTTQGNWRSVYGSDGYQLANDQLLSPAYASPVVTSPQLYTWAASTADARALQKPLAAPDRIAATWYSYGSFVIDTNITDQAVHQVALYCVDWDSTTRVQTIDVLDAGGNVLNSQRLSAFQGGRYLIWNVSGHVKFRVSTVNFNAVVSGVFFDPGPAAATFLKTDTVTKGNWRASYGTEGFTIAGDQASNPLYANPTTSTLQEWNWATSTTDTRALQQGANPAARIASTWFSYSSFVIDSNITDQAIHQVAIYCVDWDAFSRVQTIDVIDTAGNVLNSQSISNFNGGVFLVWNVAGHVKFRVTNGNFNAVVSGLFFGGPITLAPAGSASFVKTDVLSKGNWRQSYGAEGYSLAGDQSLNPAYAAPVTSGQSTYVWAPSTPDVRGLQKTLNVTDRVAATWFSGGSFTIDTNIADQAPHQVALYCLDWDAEGRNESVDVLDVNGTVLDSRALNGFQGGAYLVWNVSGHVKFRITNQGGWNAVTSGIFFGGPAAVVTAAPPIPQLSSWESRMLSGATQFCDAPTINAAIGAGGVATEANVWYYDGTKVYEQIAAYTGNASWQTCGGYVLKAYSDWVLATTAGATGRVGTLYGWRIFPHGALSDFQRTGSPNSAEVLKRLANNSAYSLNGGSANVEESRETAYMINAYVALERSGQPRSPLLPQAVTFALSHVDQWFVSKTATHVAPFMVGLTMEALMNYYELTGDARVQPAIQTAADALWSTAWVPASSAFYYDSVSDTTGAADLNLLIAPAYAWLWQKTGVAKYMTEGDQVFAGGVLYANFWTGKQYSQSYRTSFNYVKWRSSLPGTITPLTAYSY